MKKRFITRKKKKFRVLKIVLFLAFFIISLVITFRLLSKSSLSVDDKKLVEILLQYGNVSEKKSVIQKVKEVFSVPVLFLDNEYFKIEKKNIKSDNNTSFTPISSSALPTIYIYNSHQSEEYAYSNFAEYNVGPTVMFNDYVLEEVFKKNGYVSIVEQRSIKDILNMNNWRYVYSYAASRILMEDTFKNNPSLKYFIDVHRDSLGKDKTSVTIEGKVFAKTIFLIGLENENYEENLAFTEKINNLLNEKYPGLSKGIYKKGGAGVNGVYNQDFSGRVILIEVGGYENSPSEVLNSVLAFAECFMEVIKTDEG